jgi:hypothetical protein
MSGGVIDRSPTFDEEPAFHADRRHPIWYAVLLSGASMPSDSGPKIRGAVIKDARNWMRTAYGADAYKDALAALSAEERGVVDGPILTSEWYPLPAWDKFQSAMREQAHARRGDSAFQFNMRNMREAGSTTVRRIYKFVLGLMSPLSVLEKGTIIYNRAYSEGRCDIVEKDSRRAVVRYGGASSAFRTSLINNFPSGLLFLLELNGAKNIDARISRDEIVDDKLVLEVTVLFDP